MKTALQRKSTYEKLKDLVKADQDHQTKFLSNKILGTVLIALSGLILYLDKAFVYYNITLPIPERFKEVNFDQQTFVWFIAISIAPFFWGIGGMLRHYKLAHVFPIYCYSLQLFFVLVDYKLVSDDSYIGLYALGTTILIPCIVYAIRLKETKEIQDLKTSLKDEILQIKNDLNE